MLILLGYLMAALVTYVTCLVLVNTFLHMDKGNDDETTARD